ncbi:carbon-nitrogen hydrolase family protein [Gammaproteobacteria bacterium]|nr:carbon-nitrogen hydrolase family protein [Gammaproteobacteria bacterium]
MSESNWSAIIHPTVRVAAINAAPIMLDKAATVAKALKLIKEAADGGADLIVFPESFIPGFPVWTAFRRPIDGHDLFKRFALNSLDVEGPEIRQISNAAARNGIFVSLGFSEVSNLSSGCIWNTNLLLGDDGTILNHHRKIMPTFYEKLIWAAGDGAGLRVVNTRIGRIGSLICGENNNTLARYSLIAQGEQIHTACFPSVWPFRDSLNKSAKPYDLTESIRIRVGAHCFEGKVFGVVSSSYLDEDSIAMLSDGDEETEQLLRKTPGASAMVIGPEGEIMANVPAREEGMAFADIDLERQIELKQHHDLVGYYNRFDIFEFSLNQKRLTPANIRNGGPEIIRKDDEGGDDLQEFGVAK